MNDKILDNINSLIMAARSQGKQKLSVTKLLLFINEHYGLNLDQQGLEDLLGDNASVIEFNGDEIVIGEPENDDEEEASEDVHDMAVDQAADNMSMESVEFGSVLKLFEHDWTGTEISAKNVVVVGGGNVAMDVSRVAIRHGANVNIVYRRSLEEMPARSNEIQDALNEKIQTYSHGMRQKIVLISTLLHEPTNLILDEP